MRLHILTMSACAALALSSAVWAQETRGSIEGRATDPSGAVLVGAGVRVANTATGSVNELKTNERGDYVAPYLTPGPYKLEVQAAGFVKYERDGLQVDVGRRGEVDVTMTVGQSTESVLVTAEASQLETEAATRATMVESHQVADLPTSNGNPYMLLNLVPGASSARFDMRTGDRPFDPSFLISFAMDGTRANRNDLTLDGVPVTGTNGGGNNVIATWVPPTDTVAEFKVQTAIPRHQYRWHERQLQCRPVSPG